MSQTIFFHLTKQDLLPVGVKYDNISNIDKYEDNSIENILLQDLLDFYIEEETKDILNKICSKLAPDGKIIIQSIDAKLLSIAVAFGDINIGLMKQVLYPYKRSIHTMEEILSLSDSIDLKPELKRYINIFEYYIVLNKK